MISSSRINNSGIRKKIKRQCVCVRRSLINKTENERNIEHWA